MSLHPCFHRRWLLQVASEIGKSRHRTSVFFSVVTEATQDAPKASPRKNLIEQLKPLLEWMLYEKAQYAEFNVPTCGKIAVWQLRRETAFLKQSWWPEFSMFGSMPLCWFPKETPLWASALEQAFATWTAVRPLPPDRAPPFVWTTFFWGGSFVSWSAQADHCGMWKVCAHPSCTLLPVKR